MRCAVHFICRESLFWHLRYFGFFFTYTVYRFLLSVILLSLLGCLFSFFLSSHFHSLLPLLNSFHRSPLPFFHSCLILLTFHFLCTSFHSSHSFVSVLNFFYSTYHLVMSLSYPFFISIPSFFSSFHSHHHLIFSNSLLTSPPSSIFFLPCFHCLPACLPSIILLPLLIFVLNPLPTPSPFLFPHHLHFPPLNSSLYSPKAGEHGVWMQLDWCWVGAAGVVPAGCLLPRCQGPQSGVVLHQQCSAAGGKSS